MARFLVKATIEANVEILVEAETAEEAETIVSDKIAVDATLLDIPAEKFDVEDDSINDVTIDDVEEETEED